MGKKKEKGSAPNMILSYPVAISRSLGSDTETYYADSCEFFEDEQGIQWVKFFPQNGYHSGKEHMVRTDRDLFTVVRMDR